MDVSMVYAFKNEPLTPKTIQTQGVKLTLAHGSIWSKKGQSRKTIQKISITYKKRLPDLPHTQKMTRKQIIVIISW